MSDKSAAGEHKTWPQTKGLKWTRYRNLSLSYTSFFLLFQNETINWQVFIIDGKIDEGEGRSLQASKWFDDKRMKRTSRVMWKRDQEFINYRVDLSTGTATLLTPVNYLQVLTACKLRNSYTHIKTTADNCSYVLNAHWRLCSTLSDQWSAPAWRPCMYLLSVFNVNRKTKDSLLNQTISKFIKFPGHSAVSC